jgi:hypothetical protein
MAKVVNGAELVGILIGSNEGSRSSAVSSIMRASGGEASENVLKPDIVESKFGEENRVFSDVVM